MSYQINKRWRIRHPHLRNEGKKRNYAKTAFNNRNNQYHYTDVEDYLVLNSSCIDRELHRILGRSVQSIQVRRWRLRKNGALPATLK